MKPKVSVPFKEVKRLVGKFPFSDETPITPEFLLNTFFNGEFQKMLRQEFTKGYIEGRKEVTGGEYISPFQVDWKKRKLERIYERLQSIDKDMSEFLWSLEYDSESSKAFLISDSLNRTIEMCEIALGIGDLK